MSISRTTTVAGAILTGGKSSRMGTPKPQVVFDGSRTLFDRAYDVLLKLGLPRVAVGHVAEADLDKYEGLTVIQDDIANRGPVGGLHTLLKSGIAEHYLVVPCDMPLLTAELLSRLLENRDQRPSVFAIDDRVLPLPGLYPASLAECADRLLLQPSVSLMRLLDENNARTHAVTTTESVQLQGVNTPQELARAIECHRNLGN